MSMWRLLQTTLCLLISLLLFSQYRLFFQIMDGGNVQDFVNEDGEMHSAGANSIDRTPKNSTDTPSKLRYVGQFGLGHRLSKLSAAHHLAFSVLRVPQLYVDWGVCPSNNNKNIDGKNVTDIFEYLFGVRTFQNPNNNSFPYSPGKTILVRNDVHGYYAGQTYKNLQRPIPSSYYNNHHNPWFDKLGTDEVFFRDLLQRFLANHDVLPDWLTNTSSSTRQVVGLHLRAGNGEQDHFQQAKRHLHNATQVISTICQLLPHITNQDDKKKTIVFVATDTAYLIPYVQEHCSGYDVVTIPQVRAKRGVSFTAWQDDPQNCLSGWLASLTDMAILSLSNVVIAGMRSTFTQIMPLSLVLQRSNGMFCEVDGSDMTCARDKRSWLFRTKEGGNIFTVSTSDNDTKQDVTHKVMVHFPDTKPSRRPQQASEFLSSSAATASDNDSVWVYGPRFDKTYRRQQQEFRTEWTWEGKR